jgi:hypothetical protein
VLNESALHKAQAETPQISAILQFHYFYLLHGVGNFQRRVLVKTPGVLIKGDSSFYFKPPKQKEVNVLIVAA